MSKNATANVTGWQSFTVNNNRFVVHDLPSYDKDNPSAWISSIVDVSVYAENAGMRSPSLKQANEIKDACESNEAFRWTSQFILRPGDSFYVRDLESEKQGLITVFSIDAAGAAHIDTKPAPEPFIASKAVFKAPDFDPAVMKKAQNAAVAATLDVARRVGNLDPETELRLKERLRREPLV